MKILRGTPDNNQHSSKRKIVNVMNRADREAADICAYKMPVGAMPPPRADWHINLHRSCELKAVIKMIQLNPSDILDRKDQVKSSDIFFEFDEKVGGFEDLSPHLFEVEKKQHRISQPAGYAADN